MVDIESEPEDAVPKFTLKKTDTVDPPVTERKVTKPSVPATMFGLSPTMMYGAVGVVGVILLYLIFKGKKTSGAGSGGPTIVEVTEIDGPKNKSVKNSINNRVSSPRIVFGDLRKNPTLMVAPLITPK